MALFPKALAGLQRIREGEGHSRRGGLGWPFFFCFLCVGVRFLSGQPIPTGEKPSPPDSLLPKTARGGVLEGPITYEAQAIENFVREKKTVLTGKARVAYQDMVLSAEKITVDWEAAELLAEGVWDTVGTKTQGGDPIHQAVLRGAPEFKEGGDVMTGEVMRYNFKTRRGWVLRGRTAYEDGFYAGEALKLTRPQEIHVGEATFTTCDRSEPHFCIRSRQMKIRVNDRVIARPVVLYLGRIPFLAIPFAVFPIQKGRHSGFLIPRYGESATEGRYLRGIGHYWAPSDYWDIQNEIDYFEKSGFLFRSRLNYQVRYRLRGTVSGSWTRKDFEAFGRKDRRWDLNINHAQEITPLTRLTVNAALVSSGDFYRELSTSREYRLTQEIRSNAKLSHRWGRSGNLQLFVNQTRNLKTDALSLTLPEISASNRITSLVPQAKARRGRVRWYQTVQVPYSFQARYLHGQDRSPTGLIARREGLGIHHGVNVYVNPKLFGWLTVKPSLAVDQSLTDRRKAYALDPKTNRILERKERGLFHLTTYSTALAFNTKLYGVFRSRHVPGVMVRHVMMPSVSFQYRPDFSKAAYGYTQTLVDTTGKRLIKDRFAGSLFGGTPQAESQSMQLSLQNLFQMKRGEGEKARKFDLFTYTLSTAYNWKASQYKLSDLSTSLQANPSRAVGFRLGTTHSFYQTDASGAKIDRLFWEGVDWKDLHALRHLRLARLTTLNLNCNLRWSGKIKGASQTPPARGEEGQGLGPETEEPLEPVGNLPGDRFGLEEGVTPLDIPWSLSANLNYTENRSRPGKIQKTVWAQTNLDFNLTPHWKISYAARWDMEKKKAVSQDFVFYRDLHCWEARFVWTPTGPYKRFYFRINVKSPMLQELKFEKGAGRAGLYGY